MVEATAGRFQVDAETVRKWRDRFLEHGDAGLQNRSSRPHRSPNRTPRSCQRRVIGLRKKRRWGADHIAHETGSAASTVQSILGRAGLPRLDRGDRATNTEPVRRYQRDRPGELIPVDIEKIAGIPNGGWRIHGKGNDAHGGHPRVGYRYIHTAIDDRARIAYSELHANEQAVTAAEFWLRAAAFLGSFGVRCERVITDNGFCYRSRLWHDAVHRRTRPSRRPGPAAHRPTEGRALPSHPS